MKTALASVISAAARRRRAEQDQKDQRGLEEIVVECRKKLAPNSGVKRRETAASAACPDAPTGCVIPPADIAHLKKKGRPPKAALSSQTLHYKPYGI